MAIRVKLDDIIEGLDTPVFSRKNPIFGLSPEKIFFTFLYLFLLCSCSNPRMILITTFESGIL